MPIKISNVFLNEQDCSGVHLALFFFTDLRQLWKPDTGYTRRVSSDTYTRRVSSDIGNAASSTAF